MKKSKSHSDTTNEVEGTHYVINEYKVTAHAKIGNGEHSQVYSCLDQNSRVHALKVIKIASEEQRDAVMKEISLHSQICCHDHIIQLEGFHSGDNSFEILYEFCDSSLIEQMKGVIGKGFSTAKIAEIFSSIVSALKFMHQQNPPIIYRDLSPQNVLCKRGIWKLCHFRNASNKVFHIANESDRKEVSADIEKNINPSNRSPEMINLYIGDDIGTPSDIWALGCLLFNICTLTNPFQSGALAKINGMNDYQWNQPWEVDEYFKSIVAKCLTEKPSDRPTAAQLDQDFRDHFNIKKRESPTAKESRRSQRLSRQISMEISQRNSESSFDDKKESEKEKESFEHSYKHASGRPPNLPHSVSSRMISPYYCPKPNRGPVHHIKLNYDSYTKALLNASPPDPDKQFSSDESDVEFEQETKGSPLPVDVTDKDLDEFDKIEQKHMATHPASPSTRRPSVINLGTTIEKLIEYGDSQPQSILKQMNRFNEHGTIVDNDTSQMFNLQHNDMIHNQSQPFILNELSGDVTNSNLTLQQSASNYKPTKNVYSFSTSNLNKTNRSHLSSSNNQFSSDANDKLDSIYKTNNSSGTNVDYKALYHSNPNELKTVLLNLDDISLSTALLNIMTSDDASEFILNLIRESGSKGSRLLSLMPALPDTPLNKYIERRKSFITDFPMFEGNFSLYDFTEYSLTIGTQLDPGQPPISVDVACNLIALSTFFNKAFKLHKSSQNLQNEAKDLFTIISYVIAKLKLFGIQSDFVNDSLIPPLNRFQKKILKNFENAGVESDFPKDPINFEDQTELKKLRAPRHIETYDRI